MQSIDGVNLLVFLLENMKKALISPKGTAQHAQSHLAAGLHYGNLQCSHALFACTANDRGTPQHCQPLDHLTDIVMSPHPQAGTLC